MKIDFFFLQGNAKSFPAASHIRRCELVFIWKIGVGMCDAQEGLYCMVTGIRHGVARELLSRIDSFEIKVNGIFVQIYACQKIAES